MLVRRRAEPPQRREVGLEEVQQGSKTQFDRPESQDLSENLTTRPTLLSHSPQLGFPNGCRLFLRTTIAAVSEGR